MKNLSIMAIILTVSGCATVNPTYTGDGEKAYTLNCSGNARGWDKCLKSAGDICGSRGYKILDRSSEDAAIAGANNHGFFANQTNERSMLIACKK